MALKEEGIWDCDVLSAKAGELDAGVVTVQITVQITSGPSKGARCTYEEVVDARSAKYVRYSSEAVGWKGGKITDLEADFTKWHAATGGKTTVEIKHLEIKNGKNAGKTWDKVNGIGRGAARPLKPASQSAAKDADDALRSVMGDAPDGAPSDEDSIPF